MAVEDRGPWSRHRPAAARCGCGVLPVAVPQRHAAGRGRGRRPPRGQPRSRRERCRPRVACRCVGTLCRAGRAGHPDRRRSPCAAVARALVHAAGRDRARPGGGRHGARGPDATRWRSIPLGEGPKRGGRRHPRRAARPEGVAGHRARVCAGRRRPRAHLPDRRADRWHHRASVADAAAGAARDAGHGAAQRRRLGAARGRDGMGLRRGRPGCGSRGRHRRRLRRHGAHRQPARCRLPRAGMVPSYPASGAARTAAPAAGAGRRAAGRSTTCLTARTPC